MSTNGSGLWVSVDGTSNKSFALPLEIGSTRPLWVRRTRIEWTGLQRPISLLFASDLHLGTRWSSRVIDELLAAARITIPDVIVLGGDLADSRRGLQQLEQCVRQLRAFGDVWGIAGNHDQDLGLAIVRRAFESAGGRWLHDRCEHVVVEAAGVLRMDGRVDPDPPRVGARMLCAHDPAVFPEASRAGYQLVLSGHLHGSQCVFAERNGMLYPGAWFFRWNGLQFLERGCLMLVSRGMADTLPLRWNCPREVLLCELVCRPTSWEV